MIKRLVIGAALGVLGKKLYDEGRLDPYIAKAKEKVDGLAAAGGTTTATKAPTASPSVS